MARDKKNQIKRDRMLWLIGVKDGEMKKKQKEWMAFHRSDKRTKADGMKALPFE